MSDEQTVEQLALFRLFFHEDQDSSMDRVQVSTWKNQEAWVRSWVKEDNKEIGKRKWNSGEQQWQDKTSLNG